MEFDSQYNELAGKSGSPPGKEEGLMWSVGWSRGVMMVMAKCGMILGGANPGQEARIQGSSPSMLSITKREGGKESGMK
jgi:hypothetical protein